MPRHARSSMSRLVVACGLGLLLIEVVAAIAPGETRRVSDAAAAQVRFDLRPEPSSRFKVDTVAPYDSPLSGGAAGPTARLLGDAPMPADVAAHASRVTGVLFSPGGALLASWSNNEGNVKLWDLPSGSLRSTVHEDGVEALAFSKDGSLLFYGGYNDVTILTLPDAQFKARLVGFKGEVERVTQLATTQDGLFVNEGQGASFAFFSVPDLRWRATLGFNPDMERHAAISPDGKFLVVSCADGAVRVWSAPGGKSVSAFEGVTNRLAISPNGKLLADVGKTVTIRALPSGKVLSEAPLGADHAVGSSAIAFSPDGNLLAAAAKGRIVVLAAPDWKVAATFVDRIFEDGATDLAFSPDGKILAAASTLPHPTYAGSVVLMEVGGDKRRWVLIDPAAVTK